MPHRNYEVGIDKEQDLAELDDLNRVDITRRFGDSEQSLAIGLELGSLVGLHRIFHRQLVEVESHPCCLELLLGWLVEPYPGTGVGFTPELTGMFEIERLVEPVAVFVNRSVNDHARRLGHASGPLAQAGISSGRSSSRTTTG